MLSKLFYKKINQPYIDNYFVRCVKDLNETDIIRNRNFVEHMYKHVWTTNPTRFMFFSIYSLDFLAGGFKTHLDLIQHIYNKFHAQIFLCFVPNVTQKHIFDFKEKLKIYYPDLNLNIVDIKTAHTIKTDICISLNLATVQAIKYNKCKEKYLHAMDNESLFYPSGTESAITDFLYSQGLYVFTNSIALQKTYQEYNPNSAVFRYIPGIDKIYYPINPEQHKFDTPFRLVIYARPSTPRNAFSLIIPVINKLKEKLNDKIEIILVGEDINLEKYSIETKCTSLGRLNSLNELATLYRQCDFGISFITTPTFSYMHLQLMASGVCLITNEQPGIKNFLKDGDNAIVVPPIPNVITEKIIDIVNTPIKLKSIRKNAIKTIKNYTWEKCFDSITSFIVTKKF